MARYVTVFYFVQTDVFASVFSCFPPPPPPPIFFGVLCNRLIVANTHLYFHPNAAHVRLMQLVALTERYVGSRLHRICRTRVDGWGFGVAYSI